MTRGGTRRRGRDRHSSAEKRGDRGSTGEFEGVATLVLDAERRIVSWSLAAQRLTGGSAADLGGRRFSELCPGFDLDPAIAARAPRAISDIDAVIHCGDGVEMSCRLSVSPMLDAAGGTSGYAVTMRPAPADGVRSVSLAGSSRDGGPTWPLKAIEAPAILVDRAGTRVIDLNAAATEVLGREAADLSTSVFADVVQRAAAQGADDAAGEVVDGDTALIWDRRAGAGRAFAVAVVPVRSEGRQLALCILHEVTRWLDLEAELSRTNRELSRMARHDHLTGLFNKPMFQDTLALANARLDRHGGLLGVLYIDLDGFKPVNDRFGHEFGDRVLAEVGRRLRGAVRRSDVVGRLGGDEFAAILENLRQPEDALRVGNHIIETIAKPVQLDGETIAISASIGAVVTAEKVGDSAALLVQADALMYRAKGEGHGRVALSRADAGRKGRRMAPTI